MKRGYGRRDDYLRTIHKRKIRKEIITWTLQILAVIGVAALIAYYLL